MGHQWVMFLPTLNLPSILCVLGETDQYEVTHRCFVGLSVTIPFHISLFFVILPLFLNFHLPDTTCDAFCPPPVCHSPVLQGTNIRVCRKRPAAQIHRTAPAPLRAPRCTALYDLEKCSPWQTGAVPLWADGSQTLSPFPAA